MQLVSRWCLDARRLAAGLVLLACSGIVSAADSYDPASGQLNIRSLVIGNASYSDVVMSVGLGNVLSVRMGVPVGTVDTYDPVRNQLQIPSVFVNGIGYTNVLIAAGSLVSIGGASFVDRYDVASGQLRIAAVQVGGTVYNNVVVNVGTGGIAAIRGGMPAAGQDVYVPSSGQLTIATVQAGDRIYTNVVVNVALSNVALVGAASTFEDAAVQGLCYATAPSATATASATNNSGQFLYVPGDYVTFWIDGSGGGCAGTTANAATSVLLGGFTPTGSLSSVLALSGGLQAADILTTLNIGTPALMDVGGLLLYGPDVGNLNQWVHAQGADLPVSAAGSIDTFFQAVQADTTLAPDYSYAPFVTRVLANPSTTNSVLENGVAVNLIATARSLPGQPTSIPIPAGGQLRFALAVTQYTCPVCVAPSTVYTVGGASFLYFDGHGNVTHFSSPAKAKTTIVLADQTTSGTYKVTGNVLTLSETGTEPSTGASFAFHQTITANYLDAKTLIGTAPVTETFTSGPYSGHVFATGTAVFDVITLTPLTLSMLAGHTVTQYSQGCPGNVNTLTFTSSGSSSVRMTDTCGDNPVTLTNTAIPGVLEGTDATGYIVYVGLYGPKLAAGAQMVQIQEALGSQGLNGNGSSRVWTVGLPLISVQ